MNASQDAVQETVAVEDYQAIVEQLAACQLALARMRKWGHLVCDEFVDGNQNVEASGLQEWARKEWDGQSALPMTTACLDAAIAAVKQPLETRIAALTKLEIVK